MSGRTRNHRREKQLRIWLLRAPLRCVSCTILKVQVLRWCVDGSTTPPTGAIGCCNNGYAQNGGFFIAHVADDRTCFFCSRLRTIARKVLKWTVNQLIVCCPSHPTFLQVVPNKRASLLFILFLLFLHWPGFPLTPNVFRSLHSASNLVFAVSKKMLTTLVSSFPSINQL